MARRWECSSQRLGSRSVVPARRSRRHAPGDVPTTAVQINAGDIQCGRHMPETKRGKREHRAPTKKTLYQHTRCPRGFGLHITTALFLPPSICASWLVARDHLRALATVTVPLPAEPCRVLPKPKHHRSNQKRPIKPMGAYRLRFVRCRRRATRDGGGRGAGGGTTIGKRRQWWWLKWKPGWIEKVRWCSRTSTASAVVVARMHAVDAVVRNAYVCTVPSPRSKTKRETTEQPET